MKILITGSKGFIGSYIFNELKKRYSVQGIDILPKDTEEANFYNIDLTNYYQIESFFKNNKDINLIIHSAALAHNKGTDLSFDKFKQVNFETTKNLVDLSNKYLKLNNFIFFSTISVYGEKFNKNIFFESDELNPKTPYAVTKKMSEEYIIENANFDYTILRFAPVYGNKFTLNIDRRTIICNKIFRIGRCDKKLSLLNIKNIPLVVNAIIKNSRDFKNKIYNIADQKNYTYNDLVSYQLKKRPVSAIIKIPKFIIYFAFLFGNIIRNNFLIENSIKLLTDNIYDTSKINSCVKLGHDIDDIL